MSKAILIMKDIPNRCSQCKLCQLDRIGYYCAANEKGISNIYIKQNWCPLYELPQKKEPTQLPLSPLLQMQYTDYKQGWNDCLEYILEGEL